MLLLSLINTVLYAPVTCGKPVLTMPSGLRKLINLLTHLLFDKFGLLIFGIMTS